MDNQPHIETNELEKEIKILQDENKALRKINIDLEKIIAKKKSPWGESALGDKKRKEDSKDGKRKGNKPAAAGSSK